MTAREQDVEYAYSLLADQTKDILKERDRIRSQVVKDLSGRFPKNVEELLTPQEASLLRSSRFASSLPPLEQIKLQEVRAKVEHWRKGCYNMPSEYQQALNAAGRLFTLNDFPRQMCFDVGDSANRGWFNPKLDLVDVMIEGHRYPLSQEDSKRFLEILRRVADVNSLPYNMVYPQIDQTYQMISDAHNAL